MHTTNKSPQLRTDPRSPLGRPAISTYLLLYQPSIVLAVHEHVHSRSQCYLQDSPQCVILCPPTTLVRGFCRATKLLRIQSLMCQHTRCPLLCRETAKTQASEGHRQIYQRYPVTQCHLSISVIGCCARSWAMDSTSTFLTAQNSPRLRDSGKERPCLKDCMSFM